MKEVKQTYKYLLVNVESTSFHGRVTANFASSPLALFGNGAAGTRVTGAVLKVLPIELLALYPS